MSKHCPTCGQEVKDNNVHWDLPNRTIIGPLGSAFFTIQESRVFNVFWNHYPAMVSWQTISDEAWSKGLRDYSSQQNNVSVVTTRINKKIMPLGMRIVGRFTGHKLVISEVSVNEAMNNADTS